jgi:RecA-family ATPase
MNALMTAAFDAAWLMRQEFPPTKYVVPGIIPEGMTLLVAAPKIGKSWMVLGLGVELSNGGSAFGAIPVGNPRPVLYLALEDGKRRLQDRLIRLNPSEVSSRLQFMTELANGQVIATIRDYVKMHEGSDPVVILDTLGKVMPPAGNGNQYGHDYSVLSALKATTDAVPGSSLVIVHHTRKMDGGDFLDAVSGTQGIAGAADTVLVLKRDRHDDRATLQVTSRDAAEGEYSLTLTDTGRWELDGNDLAAAAQAAQTAKATAGLGDRMVDVVETVGRFPEGITPKDLKTLLPDVSNVDEYLRRAHESSRIQKLSRGLYAPMRSVRNESLPLSETHTLTQITPTDQGSN